MCGGGGRGVSASARSARGQFCSRKAETVRFFQEIHCVFYMCGLPPIRVSQSKTREVVLFPSSPKPVRFVIVVHEEIHQRTDFPLRACARIYHHVAKMMQNGRCVKKDHACIQKSRYRMKDLSMQAVNHITCWSMNISKNQAGLLQGPPFVRAQ